MKLLFLLITSFLTIANLHIAQASIVNYNVTAVFNEPLATNTTFTGSFTWNTSLSQITNLQGKINQAMQGTAQTVQLNNQLASGSDGSGGILATVFKNNSTNIFANGFTYNSFPSGNHAPTDLSQNAFFTLDFNPTNPALVSAGNIAKLVYADCSTGGLMGNNCMTGLAAGGAMGATPLSLSVVIDVTPPPGGGATTIPSGTTLALPNSTFDNSLPVINNSIFDISGTTSGVSIPTISGIGSTLLGGQWLTITNGSTTYAGAISGSGGLIVSGGTQTLSGNNTYSGGTQVQPGANLSIASGSALGSGTLALVGSAKVPATLSVTNNTTITNPLTVAGDPVFNIGSGTTTTVSSPITNGGIPGDVEVGGGGTLALTAINTYTGPTSIDSNSTLALLGNGSIANSSAVTNNGTFNIADAANTVNLQGTYTQSSTGNLTMGLTPSASQLLNVNGLASLGGTLSLNASSGTYALNKRYILITATGGISNQFATLSTNLSSFTRLSYYLSYDSQGVYLNLAPGTADTQAALAANVAALKGVYALQTGTINNSLGYDCAYFDKHGFCLSTGGRYSNASDTNANTTSAMVIGAYKINDNIRAGGYLDQNLYNINVTSAASLRSNTPLLGMFAVWNNNADKTGLEAKLAFGYNNSNLDVNRIAMGTSEPGAGSASMNTFAGSATVSYGFKITPNWMTSPYFGLRYTSVSTDGYSEQSSASVTTPLTYSSLSQKSTTYLLGVRLSGKIHERTTLQASAGLEEDMHNSVTDYSASGIIGLAPIAFNPNINSTRAVAGFGATYELAKGHQISFNTIYRQESFQSMNTKMAYINYTMSF